MFMDKTTSYFSIDDFLRVLVVVVMLLILDTCCYHYKKTSSTSQSTLPTRFLKNLVMLLFVAHRVSITRAMMSTATFNNNKNILCFGDSLTAGTSPPFFETFPYALHLQNILATSTNTNNNNNRDNNVIVRHVGFPGWTATAMVQDINGPQGLQTIIQQFHKQSLPLSLIILLAGTNDLGLYNANDIVESIVSLHNVCYKKNVPNTIAIGIPPSGYQAQVVEAREKAIGINTKLEEYCNSQHGATFMPFPFEYETGGENWSPDTLHFSPQGYKVLGESLAPVVEKILFTNNNE